MSRCSSRILSTALLIAVMVVSAAADTMYSYVGDKFTYATGIYSPGDSVTGRFVLSDSFTASNGGAGRQDITSGIASYWFTDGHQTFTQTNSTATFQFGFQPDGTPVLPGSGTVNGFWTVDIQGTSGEIYTQYVSDYETFVDMGNSQAEILSFCAFGNCYPGGPGTWTIQKVPEPGSAVLLFSGLACVVAAFRRRNNGKAEQLPMNTQTWEKGLGSGKWSRRFRTASCCHHVE